MIVYLFLWETTTAVEEESGAISKLLADPLLPSWLAAIFAFLTLIPLGIAAARFLRRRWATRHLPRNTQVQQDRQNYERLLDNYNGYLTYLRELLIIRSQTEYGNVAEDPRVIEEFIRARDELYNKIEKRGEVRAEMGYLQLLDILESRNVGIEDLIERRERLEELQFKIENHRLFIPRDESTD